jgi:ABC-type multidrug transport system fused ATPase/permease subunit
MARRGAPAREDTALLFRTPLRISSTGDNEPARTLPAFVWRMSGFHQFVVVGLALLVAGLTVVPLELQRRIIDDALMQSDKELFLTLALLFLGAILASACFKLGLKLYQGLLAESAINYCRAHLESFGGEERETGGDGNGTKVSIVINEIESVGGFVGDGFSDPAAQIGILVAVSTYMTVVEPMIALVCIGFLGPQVIIVPMIQRKLNALIEERVERLRALSDVVAAGGCDPDGTFGDQNAALFRNRMLYFLWKFVSKALINFLNALAPLLVLVIGGWMVVEGETEIGVVVAFISGFAKMSDPLRELIAYYRLYAQTSVKHALIAEWMRAHV